MNAAQLQGLIVPIGFIVIFYFIAIRPQRKRDKEIKEMRGNLRVGDEVLTIGGIRGKIIQVKDDYITLEIGVAKNKVEFTKWAIGSVVKGHGANQE